MAPKTKYAELLPTPLEYTQARLAEARSQITALLEANKVAVDRASALALEIEHVKAAKATCPVPRDQLEALNRLLAGGWNPSVWNPADHDLLVAAHATVRTLLGVK